MLHLAALLLLSIGCVLGVLLFSHTTRDRLEAYAALQDSYRVVSDVSLVINRNVSRMQVGFQHMLLASSPGDLAAAEETIRESMDTVRRAAAFLEQGGVFVESFRVNFDALDKVTHEFRLDAPVPGLDVASMELRTSVSLLERMQDEYHRFASARLDGGAGSTRSAALILMHKKLAPFFSRAAEHANRFYVQSMKDLAQTQGNLRQARAFHAQALAAFTTGSVALLVLLGALVIRSAAQVLRERAAAQRGLVQANEELEERVAMRTRELQSSEGRLRDMALTSGDIIWQTDGNGRLVYVAGQSERLLGVSSGQAVGMSLADFLPDTREGRLALERMSRRPARPVVDFACTLQSRADGRPRHFLVNAIPVREADGSHGGGYFGVAKDISEKHEYEGRLRLYEKIFETSREGITVTDADGTILVVNPAFTAITGYTAEEAVGQNPRILKSEHHPPEYYSTMWDALLRDGLWTGEIWNRRKSGEPFPEWLSITALRDEGGALDKFIAVFHDITAMKDKEQEIMRMAYYDHLTGLPNKTLLQEKFGVALLKAEKTRACHAVLYVDLDNFKLVNDSLGHEAGDELLVEVAGRFQRLVRAGDVVARLGGDEFVFLFCGSEEVCIDPSAYSERIIRALADPVRVKGQDIFVTPSIGVAVYPRDGSTIQSLLKHADLAMYDAKSTGKNQFRVFDESMTARASARLTLEIRLRQALQHGAVYPLFQPKVDLAGGRVIGVEALARWAAEDGTIVSPLEFIPVAEDTGLIVPLGRTILEQSCRAMAVVRDQTGSAMKVAVNVSARQFRHEGFVDDVRAAAERAGLPCECLELEITESLLLGDMGLVGAKLRELSELGVAVSVDDFGTGYSSLSYLSRLPLDRIKIDRSFVQRLHGGQSDVDLLQAIIQMGRSLRLRVLAEGVETRDDADTLTEMGCDEAQGYFFGRPMPLHELIVFLRKSRTE
jgi:diguanylate cyclase (GGDEF)-like protein/PAS domain S-box-containing protein